MTVAHFLRLEAKATEGERHERFTSASGLPVVIKTLRFTTPSLIPPPVASSPSVKLVPDCRPICPSTFLKFNHPMQVDQNDDADRRGSQGSGPGDSSNTPQGRKLRDKLQKLAGWRIDSSSIEFPEDGPEFRGGFATVSRAFLVSTPTSKSSADDSAQTEGESKSDSGTPKRKTVAVKKLKIENGKNKEQVLALALREAGFLTELSHENVIVLEGFVEDLSEDRVWLVFPWADNGNLKDFVASANWEIPERIWLIDDVARGVEYLHNQNPPIYHGDLKSANVLVNSGCSAVITDFGSARRLTKKDPPVQPEKTENGTQAALLLETEFCETTNTITLKGNQYTLRWAPPELLKDDEPGLWSDIWALGWVFYEVMTNSIPFQNIRKDSAVFIHVIQGNLPSVADHTSMVLMRALYSLMITCWSIDPSKRPTAEDCRKSMNWMPMISPDRQRAANTSVSRTRSPELLIQMGDMHNLQNDYINASKFFTEALDICTETADNTGKAGALLGLAEGNRLQCNYTKAVRLYSEVVQIYTNVGNRQGKAKALRGLAEVHRLQSKNSEAVALYSEVVQICTETGYGTLKARALWGLAEVYRAQSEDSKAVPLYSEAAQICADMGDRQGRAETLHGLALVHVGQNRYNEAVSLYSEVVQIYMDIGERHGRAEALWSLAEMHRLQKQYSQAVQLFSEALQIYIDIGQPDGRAWALMGLANVHRDQDQHEDAIRLYEQAAGLYEEIGDTQYSADALGEAAEARRKLEPAEAE